jgi:hypothetical protein
LFDIDSSSSPFLRDMFPPMLDEGLLYVCSVTQ